MTDETDILLAEIEEERKSIKIAFSTHDGQLALRHLQDIFSRETSIKMLTNGGVDPNGTLVCEGSRQVVIYIEDCINDDFRD